MSDFLKSLSALSFGLEDGLASVRPRLPSLYEKPPTNWAEAQDQTVLETPEDSPALLEPQAYVSRQPRAQSKEDGAIAPPGSFDRNAANQEPSSKSRRTASPVSKQDSVALSEAMPRIPQAPGSSVRHTPRFDADLSNAEHLPVKKPGSVPDFLPSIPTLKPDFKTEDRQAFPDKQAWPDSPRPQPIGMSADTKTLERRPMEKSSFQPEPDSGDDKLSHSVSKQQTDEPLLNVIRPHLQPPVAGMKNQAASAGAEPAPTIQVTIGRIEIRAAPPATVTPKGQDKKASAMSLEEYLHKRNGGAR